MFKKIMLVVILGLVFVPFGFAQERAVEIEKAVERLQAKSQVLDDLYQQQTYNYVDNKRAIAKKIDELVVEYRALTKPQNQDKSQDKQPE